MNLPVFWVYTPIMFQEQRLRIGIYGGTFDPVHNAHLVLASTALESLSLDRIIFVPSGGQSHYKPANNMTSGCHRLEMIRLAISGWPQFESSSYEVDQKEYVYTINTLRYFRAILPPNTVIYLLIGGDWIDRIQTWKEGDVLVKEFHIAAFSRPGFVSSPEEITHKTPNLVYVPMPLSPISSSEIRERLRRSESVADMIPAPVMEYIKKNNLYSQI